MSSSNWYNNPEAVVEQFRLASSCRNAVPSIVGYDELVEIRRGGQGIVFAATQRSTRRRVAIKLLLDGAFASEATRRRFEREIDLAGALRNPNIVQVYDSGMTPEGHPFFVMEFVDGDPLDRHLVRLGLENPGTDRTRTSSADAKARVERIVNLFLPICDAVQYAHQHGVIHRDIKPANIRVDREGVPRVLDFGLARATASASASSEAAITASGQFMGSLHWASPEHASGNPDSIDTRSDIYSLGVLLYHLLTARFPYPVDLGLRDVLDNILHAEAARPGQFALSIPGDLETIVLKCLDKSPARRYQSAADLAGDLRHFLAGEAILARRDSTWYTLRKTLRRHRLAAGAAMAVLAVISVGLVVSFGFWRRAEQQRRIAEEKTVIADTARRTAEQKTAQAEAVSDFLGDMLSSADPTSTSKDIRVADVLDDAALRAETEFADQPATAAVVHTAIGRSYLMLGYFDKAETQLTAAEQLARGTIDPNSSEGVQLTDLLAELRQRQSRYDDAEALLTELANRTGAAFGRDDSRALGADQHLVGVLRDKGELARAEKLGRDVLERGQRTLGWKTSRPSARRSPSGRP